MKCKHTPGPWQVTHMLRGIDCVNVFNVAGPADGGHQCNELFRTSDKTLPENESNARLIAAAPDLLQALEAAVAYLVDPPSAFKSNRDDAARMIADALRKAKGE